MAQRKHAPTAEEIVGLRRLTDIQLSSDGRKVAFVVGRSGGFDEMQEQHIWIVSIDGNDRARPFALSMGQDFSPRWSPVGHHLAFLSDRKANPILADGEPMPEPLEGGSSSGHPQPEKTASTQIFLMPSDGGEATQLTSNRAGVELFAWAPDARSIYFTSRGSAENTPQPRSDATAVDHNYKYARLWSVSISDGKTRLITPAETNVLDIAPSPDGTVLAARVSPTPRLDDVYWHSSLLLLDSATGALIRTLSTHVGEMPIRWSSDGKMIAFGQLSDSGIAQRLAVIPLAGGNPKTLDDDYHGTIWAAEWVSGTTHLIAESLEGTNARLIDVDSNTGTIEGRADVLAAEAGFARTADGQIIAYLQQGTKSAEDVWVIQRNQAPRRLTTMNPQMNNWLLGNATEIKWKNKKDGKAIYGVLITPSDFQKGNKYPTIVQVHGGPQWAWWLGWHGSWHEWGQFLASRGYVVLLPNPRGSDGQGWKFVEANRDDWGGMDYEDIVDGVGYLVDEGIADPERLAIGGWSYGGYMSEWAVTHSSRFKAAVSGAGVADLFSQAGTTDITPTFFLNYFLEGPFRRRATYEQRSPITFIENCRTPILLLHGESDERVPVAQSMQFYNGVKMLGLKPEMVTYPREHHGIIERDHQIDLLLRVLDWYDIHLK